LETRPVWAQQMEKLTPLEPGKYYHIYNRGNNRENIFREDRNYHYFMQLYGKYIAPVADTFAYCLLRNHFHFLVRVKTGRVSETRPVLTAPDVSRAFNNWFNAYAKAINKAYQRTGSLFERPFSRIEVTSDRYFLALINYIHHNPQKHGFVADFREYPYSSYQAVLSTKPTRLQRDEVLEWFGGSARFEESHRAMADATPIEHLIGDDYD